MHPDPRSLMKRATTTQTTKSKNKKKKIKVMTFTDFRCGESYNGLVDDGICRTLNVTAPDLVSKPTSVKVLQS